MRQSPYLIVSAVLVTALVVSACEAAASPLGAGSAPSIRSAADTPTHVSQKPDQYECVDSVYPASAWASTRALSSVQHPARNLLIEESGWDNMASWHVLEASDHKLEVFKVDQSLSSVDDSSHYVVRAITRGGGWSLDADYSCTPRLILRASKSASVFFASRPSPEARFIDLLLMERDCASGRDAVGRVKLVSLKETTTTVGVVIGIVPRQADQSCQSNPLTPFSIELDRPIGDRVVLDAATLPFIQTPIKLAPPNPEIVQ